jgi:hypothetical protein
VAYARTEAEVVVEWGLGTGDWGLGTGDWGLGTGDWGRIDNFCAIEYSVKNNYINFSQNKYIDLRRKMKLKRD